MLIFYMLAPISFLFFVSYVNYTELQNKMEEVINIQKHISSAQVIYKPNKYCLIEIDENTTEEDMRKYAGTCIFSHIKATKLDSPEQPE